MEILSIILLYKLDPLVIIQQTDSSPNATFCLLRKYPSGSSKVPDMTRSLFYGSISSVDTANGTMDAKSDRERPSFIRSSLYLRYAK